MGRYIYRPMNTPYFPSWRRHLASCGRRAQRVRAPSPVEIESQWGRFLSAGALREPPGGTRRRRRVFYLERVFWCFLWQVLQPRTSCRAVVRQVQAYCETERRVMDESSSAYCQARARLPVECLRQALHDTATAADRLCAQRIPGWKRPVKVVDGTTMRLCDTVANRKRYPYPTGQRRGCGFPAMKSLVLYSLASGAVLKTVQAKWFTHDMRLFQDLWPELRAGDIALGDRAFGAFVALALLPQQGVDVLTRLHQSRRISRKQAQRLGPSEWLVIWQRPKAKPDHLSEELWDKTPAQITVRVIHVRVRVKGFRTRELWLSTTLLDPHAYPAEQLGLLYLRRWELELCFRDLKTTMGMEELRCQSPPMLEKELLAFLVAHNCIRCIIAEAASRHGVSRTRISFKGALDAARSFSHAMRSATSARKIRLLHGRLLAILAADRVPFRPQRCEPRAVKRRPKNYQRLSKPRHLYKVAPHRGKPRARPFRLS